MVFLRIGGAALILAVPTARALKGRWGDLLRAWPQLVTYGLMAVAVPQLAFFYAVEHLSVGVALLLEYLGMVLVVVWQSLIARRAPRSTTLVGMALAIVGLLLVLDVFGGVRIDGIGVLFGLVAAFGLASFFLLSESTHEDSLPPLALAGVGLMAAAVAFAVLGATGVLPMSFPTSRVALAGTTFPWWVAVARARPRSRRPRRTSRGSWPTRLLGAKLASFVGLSEVMFAVLFAWLLLGELPRPVQLLGGLFILAGVVVVRAERAVPGSEAERSPLPVAAPLGDVAVVPHDRVELDRVDVASPQDQVAVVGPRDGESPAALARVS